MSMILESLVIQKRPGDNTGVGQTRVTLDENGITLSNGASGISGTAVLPTKLCFIIDLLAASVDNYIWSVTEGTWKVTDVVADQTVAGGSGATVDVKACDGTTAPASGTTQLSAAIDLATAGNNGKSVRGAVIAAPTSLVPGMRLAADFSGTLTALVGKLTVCVQRTA